MERNAFSRARAFLDFTPAAKWTALVCSVASAIFFVLMILALALFADLLVSRGQIPAFSDLSESRQAAFDDRWAALDESRRSEAVGQLGLGDAEMDRRLVSAERPAAPERELRWRAYVWLLLDERVGEQAAAMYQSANEPMPAGLTVTRGEWLVARNAGWADESRDGYGVLAAVVRHSESWGGRALAWLASWNSWMYGDGGGGANRVYLTGLFLFALATVLGRSLMLSVVNYSAANATSAAITRLRRGLYHHTFRLGTLAIRKLGPSEAVGLFTRHVEAIHDGLHVWLTRAFRYPVQCVLLLALALSIDFWLTLAFLLTAFLAWFLGGQFSILIRRQNRSATRRASNRLALLQESLTMMRLVKCYLMEPFNQSRVERQLAEYDAANRKRFRGDTNARGLLWLLACVGSIGLLYLAGQVVLAQGISVAMLFVLAVVLVSLFFPVRGMLDIRRFLRRGRESSAVVFEFLDRRGEVTQAVDAEFLPPMGKQLQFVNVSLREPGTGRMLVEGLNLSIPAGQRVCLIGQDDSELHALVYMIPRFLDPTDGEVRIDGKNIRWVTHDSLRSQIGVVMNHHQVFNDTAGNNIGCGDPAYTLPRIIEAAKLAHAHQFIQQMPAGYETPIGTLGHSLKTGERFRIALARAVLRDPAVLIIEEPPYLDEDTAGLVEDTLHRVMGGRTVIFLPSRQSTLKSADRIFILRKGKIEAVGSHEELRHSSKLYNIMNATEFSRVAEPV